MVNTQTITSSTLIDGVFACPGSEVIFTCKTRGSGAIAWRSEDYIGGGNAQLILSSDVTTTSSASNTTAMLTREYNDDGELVLESTLRIIASSTFPTSSVTCVNVLENRVVVVNFAILGKCFCVVCHVHIILSGYIDLVALPF